MKNTNWEEKKLEELWKNEPRRCGRFYIAVLPTEHKIIFFWAVEFNSVGIFWNSHLKFWKSLQIFWSPPANPSVTVCQSTGALDFPYPLVIQSVIVSTNQAIWQSHALECAPSVGDAADNRVGDYGHRWMW